MFLCPYPHQVVNNAIWGVGFDSLWFSVEMRDAVAQRNKGAPELFQWHRLQLQGFAKLRELVVQDQVGMLLAHGRYQAPYFLPAGDARQHFCSVFSIADLEAIAQKLRVVKRADPERTPDLHFVGALWAIAPRRDDSGRLEL